MIGPDTFLLSIEDRSSPVWAKIKGHLEHRLQKARERNDKPLGLEDTAQVRGEITALKGLLALGTKELPPTLTAEGAGPLTM